MVGAAARLFGSDRRWPAGAGALILACALVLGIWPEPRTADAQFLGAPAKKSRGSSTPQLIQQSRTDPNAQMLVTADEIHYDYANNRVAAVSRVQIHFAGAVLEADQVIYDQNTKRLRAEGNVRFTDADGRIVYANMLDLSEDFRDGFIDSLRLDQPDKTRIAASRAERTSGNITVFQNGICTACEPCKEDPRRPPFWQVRAARIIHDQQEKMIYYEDARVEFHGVPLAYVPFFSTPDPTVKRKTGFLMPSAQFNSVYGFGVTTPFYWALAPNYDLTITPTMTSSQGPLMQLEWRHRLMSGSYEIRAAGIWQLDKDKFAGQGPADSFDSGFRDFRGSISTAGQFALTERWVWGWSGALVTDKPFLQDYSVIRVPPEIVSQLWTAGRGDRSYFEARAIHYLGLSGADRQNELPIIHPVIDYDYTFGQPILGGEAGYSFNLVSLSRNAADFDPINTTALVNGTCTPATADVAIKTPANCLLRGIPGEYSRFSGEAHWRRTFIDPFGQIFTPFASLRVDAAALSITNEPAVSNFINTGDSTQFRAMPAVGLEYRYPFISAHTWGTQTIEPIAQVIVRPDEMAIGNFPNEDAQSFIWSDANLFGLNKFSGWDRVEGGTRANVGVQYTAQFNGGGYINMLMGQSYQLFGKNSFAVPDMANSPLDSGLETDRSDYVARVIYQPTSSYAFISRFRFDEQTFETRRMEFESRVTFERWQFAMLYGNYDAQPDIGFLTRRQGILSSGSAKLSQNWTLYAGVRFDIEAAQLNQTSFGLGYIDDCFGIRLTYTTDYPYSGTTALEPTHAVLLQISLRTLGTTKFSQRLDNVLTTTSDQLNQFNSFQF
jgi:LPS-assembly protein